MSAASAGVLSMVGTPIGNLDDVSPRVLDTLRRADVLLCTSAYEGFGLTMAEAATFGIPCASYDMPYLTVQQGGGFLTAAQQDVRGLAQAVIRLLRNGEMRRELGREARANAETRLQIDQQAMWKRIFSEQQRVLP